MGAKLAIGAAFVVLALAWLGVTTPGHAVLKSMGMSQVCFGPEACD